jgi:hypothetical protein
MKRTVLAVVSGLILAAGSANAHHGYANFFMDRTVSLEGELEEVRFVNPHVVLKVRAADSSVYTALFHQGASWFRDRENPFLSGQAVADDPRSRYTALTRQSLKVGDHIVVLASPPRDPASHEVVSIKEVRRPRDGWIWRRTAASRPN